MMSPASTAVIIAAYNAETTLERAVCSALAQADVSEVCIVDDGSTDGTAALAQRFAESDARVQVHVTERNNGPAAARNMAIATTTAPWIAILDSDDYMLAGRIAALHRHSNAADFIADELLRIAPGGAPAEPHQQLTPKPLDFASFVLGNLGKTEGPLDLGYLKPLFRRAFIDRHALRYRTDMRLGEDYEFYARALALGGRFLVCGPAGYVSVERPNSLSKAHEESDLLHLRDCDEALSAIRPLSSDERRALRQHWDSVDCRLQWRRLISAVKRRDPIAALSTFRSPRAAAFLAIRLGEQAWVRSAALARGQVGHPGLQT